MAAVISALVLGILLNTSIVNGRAWPIGSVVAVVIMGIWIKSSVDKRFEELKEQMKNGGAQTEKKED